RHTILLPTRRAARSLREAFLRACGGRAMLLPRLVPVGDLDSEELAFAGDGDAGGFAGFDIPPAVPALRRLLLLTRLVLAWGRARGAGPLTAGQAAPLARELARFLDEVQTEDRDFTGLAELVPANYAEAWRHAPPPHPIIAAGITGGVTAVADLIAVIAELPGGAVVLPGVDPMDE